MTDAPIKYLTLSEVQCLEKELSKKYNYSSDISSELSGLGSALAISDIYPIKNFGFKQILVVCGPGQNGAIGLSCAKHLKLFGYNPVILMKKPKKADQCKLLYQIKMLLIPVLDCLPRKRELHCNYMLVVDALFGTGYRGPMKRECQPLFRLLKEGNVPIASIDVPSGYDMKNQNAKDAVKCETMLSIGVPKICSKNFTGTNHHLVTRYIPKKVQDKFKLNLPVFPAGKYSVEIPIHKPKSVCEEDQDIDKEKI